jgi:hypothetical protein
MKKPVRRLYTLLCLLAVAILVLTGCSAPADVSSPSAAPELTSAPPTPFVSARTDRSPAPERLKFEPFVMDPTLDVLALMKDSQGFLWFAAEDGLYRYDGYRFRAFRPETAGEEDLPLNGARILLEDSAGRFWIAQKGHPSAVRSQNGSVDAVPSGG